ncbi:MAG TPA: hypothetical protein VEJ63_21790 [Planctomycetota bacterium]|nr:hypothetical protein [Planctomycetota bacterium]
MKYFENPFPASDTERRSIWQMLVARDSDAFAAQDWSPVENDFAPEIFEGIVANGSPNPDDWTIKYPRLNDYRDDWLRMAETFKRMPLKNISHRELIYKVSSLNEIEISGDRALCHKKFKGDEPLANGERYQISAQSLYRLHRIRGEWKIVGFVGYLPLEYPKGRK